jgi:hypothetical protein
MIRLTGSPNHQITRRPDHQITRSPGHLITWYLDPRISGSPDPRTCSTPCRWGLSALAVQRTLLTRLSVDPEREDSWDQDGAPDDDLEKEMEVSQLHVISVGTFELKKNCCSLAAWHTGDRVCLRNRRSRVHIPAKYLCCEILFF